MTVSESYEFLNLLSQMFMTLAVISGVLVAYFQLSSWRSEKRSLRKSEVAEEILSVAYETEDAFRFIRSPMIQVPVEKANEKTASIEARHAKIARFSDLFKQLHRAQILARAVIGDQVVVDAIDVFFDIRSQISLALEEQFEMATIAHHSSEERERSKELRQITSGRYNDDDQVWKSLGNAIKTLDEKLIPFVRLE